MSSHWCFFVVVALFQENTLKIPTSNRLVAGPPVASQK